MIIRSVRDVRDLIADGRQALRLSQTELAERIGVSRQWVSLVERGRTSPEFVSVLNALHALGYSVSISREGEAEVQRVRQLGRSSTSPATRTPLTSQGKDLRSSRETRTRGSTDG
ncbi:MAG: helix-turn-helix domain-containing protein [Thioalkalivibrio sp.]|nr:helix-turn-helix domain-containing protein [Thioalkalivibrio sp.]